MKNGRKKIIIGIVIIFIILIMAIGSIFVYITTDLFKSNQTLFFKYMGQTLESIKYVENTQLSKIEALKEEKPYTLMGNLSFEEEETSNILSQINLSIESKVNKPEEKAYTKANLFHNSQNIVTLEYVNSNNIHALKSDEIVTAFLGIENENLKVLAQKLGIYDTSAIPDTIEEVNINEILSITEEEKTHITETYLPILIKNINKDNFTKESNLQITKENVNYNVTAYGLILNNEELKQIEIALLQALKEDSITLNILTTKAKILGLDENYTEINKLTKQIEKQINIINNGNTIQDSGIKIIVYVDNQKVILTEIINRDEIKYTIYGEIQQNSNKRYLLIENLGTTAEYNKLELQQTEIRSDIESSNNILINVDDIIGIDIYLNNNGSATENSLNTTCDVTISQDEQSWSIGYKQEMNFEDEINDMIELNRNNCGVLNDYTTEQLQSLIQSLSQRINLVINQKLEKMKVI